MSGYNDFRSAELRAPHVTVPFHISLEDESVDETAGLPVYCALCREVAAYITWSAGVVSGGITFETSEDETYTGTWAPVGNEVPFSGTAPRKTVFGATGVYAWVRARISTVVAGGTVTVRIGAG